MVQGYTIPKEIWNQASKEFRDEFIRLRRATRPNDGPSPASNSGMPKQYNKAANVASEPVEQFSDSPSSDSDIQQEDVDAINRAMNSYAGTAQWHRSHLEYCQAFEGASTKVGVAISDAGADTIIAGGNHWYVKNTHLGAKANVIGFDSQTARKFGLDIVDALTYVETMEYSGLVLANSCILNPNSNTSLLSEFQMRDYGLIVDSTSNRHRGVDGLPGRQHIVSKDDKVTIPLHLNRGLMVCNIRMPTEKEMEDYTSEKTEAIILTAEGPWNPADHCDSPSYHVLTALRKYMHENKCLNDDQVASAAFIENASLSSPEANVPDQAVPVPCFDENVPNEDGLYFFDPSDDLRDRHVCGKAVHLTVDYQLGDSREPQFVRSNVVESFLEELSDDQLFGKGENFDSFAFAFESSLHRLRELEEYQPYLAYKPIEVIKRTLENTTQLAKIEWRYPLRKHVKSRFPWLRRKFLDETVSTDTISGSTNAYNGHKYLQVFYGVRSHCINVAPMNKKSDFPKVYLDFIRQHGSPSVLRRDMAGEELSAKVAEIQRENQIKDEWSEPHNQQQNPVELNAVRWLKDSLAVLLARSGAPEWMWIKGCEYLAAIHNILADESLDWMVPHTKRTGQRVDISAFLHFKFWQKVLFLDQSSSFPDTKERPGYWLGVAENIGDEMTFAILTADTLKIMYTSVVRPATDQSKLNVKALWPPLDNEKVAFVDPPAVGNDDIPAENPSVPDSSLPSEAAEPPIMHSIRNRTRARRTAKHKVRFKDAIQGIPLDQLPKQNQPPQVSQSKDTAPFDKGNSLPRPDSGAPPPIANSGAEPSKSDSGAPSDANSGVKSSDSGGSNGRSGGTSTQAKRPHRNRRRPARYIQMARRIGAAWSYLPLLWLPGLIIHQCHSIMHFPNSNMDIPENHVMDEVPSMYPEEEIATTAASLEHFRYIHACDSLNEMDMQERADRAMWTPHEVLKHRIENRALKKDGRVYNKRHLRLLVLWRGGCQSWIQAEALKNEEPLLIIHYAMKNKLQNHRDFNWIKGFIKDPGKLERVTKAFAARSNAPRYKFGIQVPRSVQHAFRLDQANKEVLWKQALDKEVNQINDYETFRVLEDDEVMPDGYKEIPYHFVFDVKFDLRRKARLVAGGNHTNPIMEDLYSGVIGMDTVRLAFSLATMNNLLVCAADVGNAFLYGTTREKVYVIAGPEFGEHAGKRMIVQKGLYGLKSSAARFHEHLSKKLRKLGFAPSAPDANLWMRDCGDHFEYIATYVDDLLVMSRDPIKIIDQLKKEYILKGVGTPEYYLGGDIEDISEHWSKQGISTGLSAKTYIENVVKKLEQMMDSRPFPKAKSPMMEDAHPELDESPLLDPDRASKYRALIGSANWVVTLGRFDDAYATNTLARFSMAPREGHLEMARRLFGYLKTFSKGRIIIDSRYRDWSKFPTTKLDSSWSEFYPDATEDIPSNMPTPKGKTARITVCVDADHAHDKVTRRSVTGILLFVNNTPIRWISKRQPTVETATYGSELVAARIASEIILEYRYTLRMLGVPIDGPSLLLGDNMSVILNTTTPSSMLKKKHLGCAYHRVRECIAGQIIKFHHVSSEDNYADLLTKPLSPAKMYALAKPLLFRSPETTKTT